MVRAKRRKCKSCLKLFHPDPRCRSRQRYCSAPRCTATSKDDSQARWLAAPENRDYFHGPVNVARVQQWRARNRGSQRKAPRPSIALQDERKAQPIGLASKKTNPAASLLQEIITAQPAVLIGLIAHLVGTPLQDDIVRAAHRLVRIGRDILAASELGPVRARARPNRPVNSTSCDQLIVGPPPKLLARLLAGCGSLTHPHCPQVAQDGLRDLPRGSWTQSGI
jgi:hypothetical protein